jgi:hypothetical protein
VPLLLLLLHLLLLLAPRLMLGLVAVAAVVLMADSWRPCRSL